MYCFIIFFTWHYILETFPCHKKILYIFLVFLIILLFVFSFFLHLSFGDWLEAGISYLPPPKATTTKLPVTYLSTIY